ncbi:MAG: adenylate/guanylate cyclase domain-containing protein, partial [Acidimicrobiia bacterium]|nr:adenylate/guanylate cyclase domain-containing protein [Acidimicrobiia bacterium]
MPVYLFTDLESSTRLWEHHPDKMTSALARHDAILRDAIADAGGVLVKSTGDGLLAAFETPRNAVDTALAAQRALVSEEWPTPEPLRVRMGVHVGEGELRDGDYFGPAVNRAARIMDAAHGGQVLLSADVAAVVSTSLPDGATLTDLGIHRLKDLILPERLFRMFSGFFLLGEARAAPIFVDAVAVVATLTFFGTLVWAGRDLL